MNDDDSSDDDDIPFLQNLDDLEESTTPVAVAVAAVTNNDDNNNNNLPNRVPVTILTGFLGSGKTTLIRHILTSTQHNKRIAIIENEYGGGEQSTQLAQRLGLNITDMSTLSVETMIAKDGTSGSNLTDFIELPNGCVCCTVKDSLVETLENLLNKRTELDYVIIEASGMADPGPVASIFWLDDALNSRIQLDGIVTCVDAKNVLMQLESTSSSTEGEEGEGGGDEAARQIGFADRIIVNKVDLLQSTSITIESILQTIKSINSTAPIKTTTYSNIEDLNWILDANCYSNDTIDTRHGAMEDVRQGACSNPYCLVDHSSSVNNDAMLCGVCTEPSPPPPPLHSTQKKQQQQHQHTNAVGTISLFNRGSVNLHKINLWLASILWPDQDESDKVLRARLEKDLLLLSRDEAAHVNDDEKANNDTATTKRKQQIYRIKGILSVQHTINNDTSRSNNDDWVDDEGCIASNVINLENCLDKRRFIVQAVNDLWDVLPASENLCWDANDTRWCKIVVIGKWLDNDQLQQGFNECFVNS